MSKLKKKLTSYINDHLEHPDIYSEITKKTNLQKNKKENVFYMKKSALRIVLPCLLGLILVVSLVLVISLTGTKQVDAAPVATIQMDVNPSISFVVDSEGNVVSIYGENDEGKMMITGTSYTGKKLEVVIEDIIKDEQKTGFIVNVNANDEQKITFTIEGISTDVVDDIEKTVNSVVSEVCDKLEINEKIEIIKSDTKDALVKRAMELDPTLSIEAAKAKTNEELIKYIAGCQIEKVSIPTEELEKLYDQLKEEKINIVERDETKKFIDNLDTAYQTIITKYDSLYESLNNTTKQLDDLYFNSFISTESDYQKYLNSLKEAKAELLKFKNELSEMSDSDPLKVVKQAELYVYTTAVETCEKALTEVKNLALKGLEQTKESINHILEQMDEIKEQLPTEIKQSLTETLVKIEDNMNQIKDEAFKEFEEKYKEEIENEINKAKAYKAELVNNLKK